MQSIVVIAILIGVLVVTLVRQRKARKARLIVARWFATLNLKGAGDEALVQADTVLEPRLNSMLGRSARFSLLPKAFKD